MNKHERNFDKWLKILIATACLLIICATGYYLWSEFQSYRTTQRIAKYQKERSICLSTLKTWVAEPTTMAGLKVSVRDCVMSGYISAEEIKDARGIR